VSGAPSITRDFILQVQRGEVDGWSAVSKFGHRDSVSTSVDEIIQSNATVYTGLITAARAVRVKAGGDANDTNSSGTGARKIIAQGLDDSYVEAEEEITLKGALVSDPTSTLFTRIYRSWVHPSGTYHTGNGTAGANVGAIEIENTDGVGMAHIRAGEGQTQMALYSVPAGKTAYVYAIRFFPDSTKTMVGKFWQRQNIDDVSGDVSAKRLVHQYDGLQAPFVVPIITLHVFPEKTDIWITGQAVTTTGSMSGEFDLLLETN